MGYFDALTTGAFKTAQDGRRLFFPWGAVGRGYVLASEQDYERLHRQIKIFMIVAFVLIVGTMLANPYVGAAVTVLLMLFYAVWALYRLRGLQPSEGRLSVQEIVATQAVTHSAPTLWTMEILSLLFVVLGLVILAVDPREWLAALALTLFFGACAAVFAWMLVLRYRRVTR